MKKSNTCFVMMPFSDTFDTVKEAIREAVDGTKGNLLFVRADEYYNYGKITNDIADMIRRSHICIADITGKNPNVIWELGFAIALEKPIIFITQKMDDMFFDVKDFRAIPYSTDDNGIHDLKQKLKIALNQTHDIISPVPIEKRLGPIPFPPLKNVLASSSFDGTPFDFFTLLNTASKAVFVAAQNHKYLCDNKTKLEKTLFDFLEGDENRKVSILLCNPDIKHAVKTWQFITKNEYEKHLIDAVLVFRNIAEKAKKNGYYDEERFCIKLIDFVPISITFIDPDDSDSGYLVMVPNAYESKRKGRPLYAFSKKINRDLFDKYWESYEWYFSSSEAAKDILS